LPPEDNAKAAKRLKGLLDLRLGKQELVQSFFRRVTKISDTDFYAFLTPETSSRSMKQIVSDYSENGLSVVKSISNLSVEMANELCDHLGSSTLAEACRV
jgi:hypothetical protein